MLYKALIIAIALFFWERWRTRCSKCGCMKRGTHKKEGNHTWSPFGCRYRVLTVFFCKRCRHPLWRTREWAFYRTQSALMPITD